MLQLEKYKGRQTRHNCPACGQRQVFVRYVDERGEYLADDVGRCNRESNCGFHRTPKEQFAEHPTEHAQHVFIPRSFSRATTFKAKPFDSLPVVHLERTLVNYECNGLVEFLLTRLDPSAVNQAVTRYLIGTDGERCVFWQIDQQGRIRTGKLIAYNPTTGKRRKEANASWLHSELKKRGALPESFELGQCFFGEHLLKAEPTAPIAIVEAEKTAVIASLILPEFVWLASGGKTQLNAQRLNVMRNRRVLLFPDGDAFERWQAVADEATAQGLDVRCSDLIELQGTSDEKAEGFDLADYLLASIEPRNAFAQLFIEADEETRYAIEERAAIMEFEAGLSRSEAEMMAAKPKCNAP